MTHRLTAAALVAALAALVAAVSLFPPPAAARERETVHQTYEAGSGARLSLKNLNGDVRIEGWDKSTFDVTAVKTAETKERLDDVDIEFRMEGDHLTIEVDHDNDHRWSRHDEGAGVEFTIRVPRRAEIREVDLVNGHLSLAGISGDVDASSVNGDVSGEQLGGAVELSAVNGEVSLIVSGESESIDLSSVNGGVHLVLPRKIDAHIEASTVHGSIVSSDGLEVDRSNFVGSSLKGTIGRGGMKIDLDTVNGSIEIRREGDAGAREREN